MATTEKLILIFGLLMAVLGIWAGSSSIGTGVDEDDDQGEYVATTDLVTKVKEPKSYNEHDAFPEPVSSSASGSSGTAVLSLPEFYERVKDAIFYVYTSDGVNSSQGTGFFISADGRAVSNYHVFDGAISAYVELGATKEQFPLEGIVKLDPENDIVVFDVGALNRRVKALEIEYTLPKVGEECYTIGNPRNLDRVLSRGIISGYPREDERLIMFSAEITHGSSGGPLFNSKGKVVGITTAGAKEANLNFAIKIDKIR